jgi:hypothetical protein
MQVNIATLERLVSACDVIEVLTREHERHRNFDSSLPVNRELCRQSAIDTVLVRLVSGSLKAWSITCFIDSTFDTGPMTTEELIATGDFHRSTTPAKIPVEFWWHFQNAGRAARTFDPVSGDFRFEYLDGDYSNREGSAFGVTFDPYGLPAVATKPDAYLSPPSQPAPASQSIGAATREEKAQWVTPHDAVEALARLHDLAGKYADYEACLRAAEETIIGRLEAGVIATPSPYSSYTPGPRGDEFLVEHKNEIVPSYFWFRWNRALPTRREADWIAGDFKFDDSDPDDMPSYGQAFNVRIDARALPWMNSGSAIDQSSRIAELEAELAKATIERDGLNKKLEGASAPSTPTSIKSGGRKPASWWPDFAEELAVHIYDEGLPAGVETGGQTDMIAAIFARMTERGKDEPSRTQVQPVINAVLRRLRPAGN